jgi:hypothetical protein
MASAVDAARVEALVWLLALQSESRSAYLLLSV